MEEADLVEFSLRLVNALGVSYSDVGNMSSLELVIAAKTTHKLKKEAEDAAKKANRG